ncbi:hypothetical protein SAMN05877809_102223 [Rhodobacter sp. JA431]|uniref:hypothetical protein n=1 Tax=Rhodobacter sp. JA431 TaxID=570013 RepID=UPI000BD522CE|nr:hypothetical protein [Rhodobacter sp. JA431]SOB98378.1 hypothetical protein SAMN05877809_102223 [Rhodobacter sp. JA431]
MFTNMSAFGLLFGVVVSVLLFIWLPASMAKERGRSAVGWVLISLFFSPLIAIIGLLVLGPTVEQALARRGRGRMRR